MPRFMGDSLRGTLIIFLMTAVGHRAPARSHCRPAAREVHVVSRWFVAAGCCLTSRVSALSTPSLTAWGLTLLATVRTTPTQLQSVAANDPRTFPRAQINKAYRASHRDCQRVSPAADTLLW